MKTTDTSTQSDHANVITDKLEANHATATQSSHAHHEQDVQVGSVGALGVEGPEDASEFALTEEVDVKSRAYKLAVTAFWLKHRFRQIIADNEGADFLTSATILKGLKRHSFLDGIPGEHTGIPDITEQDVAAVVGFGGWELPWLQAKQGIAYDLNYVQATLRERAAVHIHVAQAELHNIMKAA